MAKILLAAILFNFLANPAFASDPNVIEEESQAHTIANEIIPLGDGRFLVMHGKMVRYSPIFTAEMMRIENNTLKIDPLFREDYDEYTPRIVRVEFMEFAADSYHFDQNLKRLTYNTVLSPDETSSKGRFDSYTYELKDGFFALLKLEQHETALCESNPCGEITSKLLFSLEDDAKTH